MYQVPDELMKNAIMCIQNATHGNIPFIQIVGLLKKLSDSKVEEEGGEGDA